MLLADVFLYVFIAKNLSRAKCNSWTRCCILLRRHCQQSCPVMRTATHSNGVLKPSTKTKETI